MRSSSRPRRPGRRSRGPGGDVLGRLLGRIRRPRRVPVGGRIQLPLAAGRRRQRHPAGLTGAATKRNDHGPPDGRPVSEINRRRPTLPGPCGPSTIGAEGLNCSVRNGKRCFPLAKATGKGERPALPVLQNCTAPRKRASQKIRQALDPLVPVSYGRYRPSRSGLSTWWSTRGLTPSRGWENSS